MTTPRQKLQSLLYELFQFDSADLNFGLYAVMNRKRQEIDHFIRHHLLAEVEHGLQQVANQSHSEAKINFDAARNELIAALGPTALQGDELAPDFANLRAIPVVQNYLKAKAERAQSVVSLELEMDIYNALYEFFSRYYKDGDFMAERRYGHRDSYAIPYNGDEVYLHWANRDQYYVKSSEYFTNYRFTIKGTLGMAREITVAFVLTVADTARDNNKAPNRYFIQPKTLPPTWDAAHSALQIPFQYRPLTDEEKATLGIRGNHLQARLNEESHTQILAALQDAHALTNLDGATRALLQERLQAPHRPTDAGGHENTNADSQDVLAYQLGRYTAVNSRDFFVHKDLGGFLTREFDYYLKAEVADLDNLQSLDPVRLQQEGAKIATTRTIGHRIIAFLDQLESFQKLLFLKPKFVLQSDYCLTLDKIPAAERGRFYPRIAANARQRAEWEALYGVKLDADADLDPHPHLMVDTAFFDADFKLALLACFDDLDEACDGLLVHGENFQALGLIYQRFIGAIDCIYIDPPYNTGSDEFIYKDTYQHSSWMSMIADRINLGKGLLRDDGTIFTSIDENEETRLRFVLDKVMGSENLIANLVWEKGRKNDAKLFSVGHEYLVGYAASMDFLKRSKTVWREPKLGAIEIWNEYLRLRNIHGEDDAVVENDLQAWYRQLPTKHPSKALSRYRRVDQFGPWRDRDISWPGGGGPTYDVIHPVTKKPCKVPERGWGISSLEAMQRQIDLGLVVFRADHTEPPFRKAHLRPISDELVEDELYEDEQDNDGQYEGEEVDSSEIGMQVMSSVIYKQSQVAVKYLRNLMGRKAFNNPKDHLVLERLIRYVSTGKKKICMLDFFAGSGASVHAILERSRSDEETKASYVAVEMADHFNTVLKPRIQKVAYAAEWKNGKPVSDGLFSTGLSHMFQYLRLESYDDTFHNIAFTSDEPQPQLWALDDYLLTYLLPHETQESPTLLNLAQLRTPFAYQLNVATTGGVLQPTPVDLITTFNFLLGLRVRTVRAFPVPNNGDKLVRVTGVNRQGERLCILWRTVPAGPAALDAERDWLRQAVLADVTYDRLYINGDTTLPDATILDAEFKRLLLPQEGV